MGAEVGGADAVLVVGANQAGVQVAATLREKGETAPIVLVGAEAHLPYRRPPLTKGLLSGKETAESLRLRSPEWFAEQGIEVVCGERVEELAAGVAVTSTGRRISYGRLALTVGARPRRIPGDELAGVLSVRDLDDALLLGDELRGARRAVVVGGGFLGLEAAAVMRAAGLDVSVVEAADRLMARAVAPAVSDFYLRTHTARGVAVHLGVGLRALRERAGRVTGVELTDGRVLPADVVLLAIGVVPRTELAEQLGLEVDGGIVVDGCGRTSRADVVAAGDCAVRRDPVDGGPALRLESVQNAVDQARAAAAALLGRSEPSDAVPWFWSDQYDVTLQVAGLTRGHDHTVVRGDPQGGPFSVLFFRRGLLQAIEAVDRTAEYLTVRKALGRGETVPIEAAHDDATPLKRLLRPASAAVA